MFGSIQGKQKNIIGRGMLMLSIVTMKLDHCTISPLEQGKANCSVRAVRRDNAEQPQ